jgi:hypothetical protein
MMNILEKLKAIGLNFPKLKHVSLIKLSININKSIRVDHNSGDGPIVIINPHKLNHTQQIGLKQVLQENLEAGGTILEEKNSAKVGAVVECLPGIHEVVDKFRPIIPVSDIPLLQACVFLRLKYQQGECVNAMKAEITRVYGTRGSNFANLCSAGYLEEWFLPLYDELVKVNPDNPIEAKARFLAIYKTIVNELPWTEFVSHRTSAEILKTHIIEKMTRNVGIGVRFMNVHGLGEANVAKIMRMLPEIQTEIGAIAVRIDKDPARVFVRLEIPQQLSS